MASRRRHLRHAAIRPPSRAAPAPAYHTTPRPIPLIKRLIADPRTAVTRAATQANAAYLSPAFLDEVLARYAGTRLGRQEIDGEIIEDLADALWTRTIIEASRVPCAPALSRVVIGVDPPGSARPGADACGIVAAGMAEDGCIYMLKDATVQGLAPAGWATKAVALFNRLKADALVAEVNQGGDMVRASMLILNSFLYSLYLPTNIPTKPFAAGAPPQVPPMSGERAYGLLIEPLAWLRCLRQQENNLCLSCRFGAKYVRFTPESGHLAARLECPLRAKSGHPNYAIISSPRPMSVLGTSALSRAIVARLLQAAARKPARDPHRKRCAGYQSASP